MNYDHNKNVGLFKFQSGYRKLYLNRRKGYRRNIINEQTEVNVNQLFTAGISDKVILHKFVHDFS